MATAFFKKPLFSTVWLFLIFTVLHAQESAEFSFNEGEDEKQAFWKILENVVRPEESDSFETNEDYASYEEVEESNELKEFNDRHIIYPESRAVLHKVCKVETLNIPLESDIYEYSVTHYKNLTCEETTDKPFEIKTPHNKEYCVIVHHPHESVSCKTRHIRVPLFRRKSRRHHWEKTIQTIAVGCDCSVGLKYL